MQSKSSSGILKLVAAGVLMVSFIAWGQGQQNSVAQPDTQRTVASSSASAAVWTSPIDLERQVYFGEH